MTNVTQLSSSRLTDSGYRPIGDYAIVGDCHTAALISRDGSVDWYCPERFDAPAALCRLLDRQKGGYLQIVPTGLFSSERRYRPSTNVLETTFMTANGSVRITDVMPLDQPDMDQQTREPGSPSSAFAARRLLRLVEGLAGRVEMELRFKPTVDYARSKMRITAVAGHGAIGSGHLETGPQYLTLACPGCDLKTDGSGTLVSRLVVETGDRRWIILADSPGEQQALASLHISAETCEADLARTAASWEWWCNRFTYRGRYRKQVLRSALALKLLTYVPTGALVAAPTTSLPEAIGGVRNWDYRYTWLRDSARILYALMTVGADEEAGSFIGWLRATCPPDVAQSPQVLYGIDGRKDVPEVLLDHLEGYAGSQPVRIGNAAAQQVQLDIYGEVLRAAYLQYRHHRLRRLPTRPGLGGPSADTWRFLRALVEHAAASWSEPDNGIWEVRGEPRHFLYSKLMCWCALDRGVRLAQAYRLDAPVARWNRTRRDIKDAILHEGFNMQKQAFTQSFGSKVMDATALAIPTIGFLPATDPRFLSTLDRIRAELTDRGLVHRYCSEDGVPGGEGTFTLCSFWMANALALAGRLDEAHETFENVVGFANDVGLLSEEIDPVTGALLGNFPQGFTHLGLIGAAVDITKATRHGVELRAETEGDRVGRAYSAGQELASAGVG